MTNEQQTAHNECDSVYKVWREASDELEAAQSSFISMRSLIINLNREGEWEIADELLGACRILKEKRDELRFFHDNVAQPAMSAALQKFSALGGSR